MNYLQPIFKNKFTLLFSLILESYTLSVAQSDAEIKLAPFLILVESTDFGLKFKCPKGCAWTDLSFTLYEGESQGVNQGGMANVISNDLNQENGLADFHFEVKKDDKNIYLKGLKGTAWLDLSFMSDHGKFHQYFDEYGTRNID